MTNLVNLLVMNVLFVAGACIILRAGRNKDN